MEPDGCSRDAICTPCIGDIECVWAELVSSPVDVEEVGRDHTVE